MKKIIGHQKQLSILKKIIEGGNLSRSIIFSGSSHLGKKEIAFWFAKKILCGDNNREENKKYPEPILSGTHPDFLFIEPEEGSKEIKINQAREIKEFSSVSPQFSKTKVVIINQAEKLNINAQNSLLKILEEPKSNLLIILIVSELGKIISTVQSRCLIIKFYPISFEEIKKEFRKKISDEKLEKLFFFSGGRPGKIINLLDIENGIDKFFSYLRQVENFLNSNLFNKMIFSKKMFEKKLFPEKLIQFLEFVEFYLLYSLIKKANDKDDNFKDIFLIKDKIREVEEMKNLVLVTNVNKRIAFESLLIKMDGLVENSKGLY